jgi:hypothetical protein
MWEEVVAYNDLVNFIEDTNAIEEGEWKFKEILHHNGPLTKTSPNYKGSRSDGMYRYYGRLGRYLLNPSRYFDANLWYAPSTLGNITY